MSRGIFGIYGFLGAMAVLFRNMPEERYEETDSMGFKHKGYRPRMPEITGKGALQADRQPMSKRAKRRAKGKNHGL